MAGMTDKGFTRKTFNDIYNSLQQKAVPIFQDLVKPGEVVDTSSTSTIGRFIGLLTPDLDELWQASLQIYQAFDPDSASGVALDNIVQYMGITRSLGSSTVVYASVWGTPNTFIPVGSVISNTLGDRFLSVVNTTLTETSLIGATVVPLVLTENVEVGFTLTTSQGNYTVSHRNTANQTVNGVLTAWLSQLSAATSNGVIAASIDSEQLKIESSSYYTDLFIGGKNDAGVARVKKRMNFASEEEGEIPAQVGTVRSITTPIYGWLSVNNEIASSEGSVFEDDATLRRRFSVSKAIRSAGMSDSLYSQLMALDNVGYVRIYENWTDVTDVRGLPPHSFAVVIQGGVDSDIAKVIWENKPLGIATHGNVTEVITDSQGFSQSVKFNRGVNVNVYVRVMIIPNDDFPRDGSALIRESIMGYINTLPVGTDVTYSRLFSPINAVAGHSVQSLRIGISPGSLTTNDVVIPWNAFPATDIDKVEVIVASDTGGDGEIGEVIDLGDIRLNGFTAGQNVVVSPGAYPPSIDPYDCTVRFTCQFRTMNYLPLNPNGIICVALRYDPARRFQDIYGQGVAVGNVYELKSDGTYSDFKASFIPVSWFSNDTYVGPASGEVYDGHIFFAGRRTPDGSLMDGALYDMTIDSIVDSNGRYLRMKIVGPNVDYDTGKIPDYNTFFDVEQVGVYLGNVFPSTLDQWAADFTDCKLTFIPN